MRGSVRQRKRDHTKQEKVPAPNLQKSKNAFAPARYYFLSVPASLPRFECGSDSTLG